MPIIIKHKRIRDHLIELDAESLADVDLVILRCKCGWVSVKDQNGLGTAFDALCAVSEHYGEPPPPEFYERRDAMLAEIEAEGEEQFLERFAADGIPVLQELWDKAGLTIQDAEKESA